MIAIRLWSYEPFKVRYTLRFNDKPFISENFSFVPFVLGYTITLGHPSIFISFICPLELGEHKIYG